MIASTGATASSISARTGLTYINILVTGATAQGLYNVVVPAQYIDDSMVTAIRALGYTVSPKNSFMGSHYDYVISWPSS
jgi:hypothetical protein